MANKRRGGRTRPSIRRQRTLVYAQGSRARPEHLRANKGLEVNATVCPMGPKHPEAHRLLRRKRQCASSRMSSEASEVEWHLLLQCHEARQTRRAHMSSDQEEWDQIEQYWELQHKLEQEFLETLDGPAVAVCGLTAEQLAELQTRELNPEDYDLLLALDEQIEKKTVDQSDIDAFESRPVTPSCEIGGEMGCSVCLMDFLVGDKTKVLPCGHLFHKECIAKWLGDCNVKCPNCGMDVSPKK
eukprot:TRINITY_DN6618_c0_g1_i7.p1 TRINITY_DN6618_c0_g1~~TRINITY_DN6618_c0_g1_i7.p1  ORF type:complete len:242 (-),score=34.63 TRINITY_DN6618_c0_g1_i7:331-1056(-)